MISALSLNQIKANDRQHLAQATQPLQSTPGAETKPAAPPEPVTTGTRPSAVPPEPARPDAEAQKAGAQPVLPPAPAEKTAAPIHGKIVLQSDKRLQIPWATRHGFCACAAAQQCGGGRPVAMVQGRIGVSSERLVLIPN